jgi:hypothetical protein
MNDLPWTFPFELQIAAPLCGRKSVLATIQVAYGHHDQSSASTSFIFSRCTDIRKHVVGRGNVFALPTKLRHDLLDAGQREIRGMGAVGACRGGQARVVEGSNIFGLMVYSAGMILIVGALTWASYADHRRDKHKQSAKR